MTDEIDGAPRYRVVVNDEGQHSVWPVERDVPAGWHPVGEPASKQDCLSWIGLMWTDITPLSVRRRLDRESA
ncbi:MbtH family protein [Actinosynnema sp. NPDC020468]|uniref:MbtH family protein n=1 Tax=Actinosynnema sp. NPDC020468 TaxID=3154488 RepID=UPI0033DABF7E